MIEELAQPLGGFLGFVEGPFICLPCLSQLVSISVLTHKWLHIFVPRTLQGAKEERVWERGCCCVFRTEPTTTNYFSYYSNIKLLIKNLYVKGKARTINSVNSAEGLKIMSRIAHGSLNVQYTLKIY